jgi:hypothetical protein
MLLINEYYVWKIMAFITISADSSIEEKISWADACYRKYKNNFLEDVKIQKLLNDFQKASSESLEEMIGIGLVEECRKCEEEEGGACCGKGIENRYSGTLLLINLLLGTKLPSKAPDPKSCFFLGTKGCSLSARHVICVNYICKKITDSIPGQALNHLREKEGTELDILFILNEKIKSVLRNLK